jgi:hypothetical protein
VYSIIYLSLHTYCTIQKNTHITSSPPPELTRELIHSIQRLHNMLKLHPLPLAHRKTMRSSTRILNLPPVNIPLRQFLDLLGGDGV